MEGNNNTGDANDDEDYYIMKDGEETKEISMRHTGFNNYNPGRRWDTISRNIEYIERDMFKSKGVKHSHCETFNNLFQENCANRKLGEEKLNSIAWRTRYTYSITDTARLILNECKQKNCIDAHIIFKEGAIKQKMALECILRMWNTASRQIRIEKQMKDTGKREREKRKKT